MGALLDIVLPVFGIVGLGFAVAKLGWFDAAATRGLSFFVFNFAMPAALFRSLAVAPLPVRFDLGLLVSYYGASLVLFAIGMAYARIALKRDLGSQGICGLAASFPNAVMLGIPIVLPALGPESAVPYLMLLSVHTIVMFTAVTVVLETARGRAERDARGQGAGIASLGHTVWATVKGLMSNVIFLGILAGLLWNLAEIGTPPRIMDRLVELLGQAGVPAALFALGSALARLLIPGTVPTALALTVLKLIVHPLLVWVLAVHVFHMDTLWAQAATLMAALPIGANVYLFADRYQTEVGTAAFSVVVSTAISVVTLTLLLAAFVGT